jgi:hypothetical protein
MIRSLSRGTLAAAAALAILPGCHHNKTESSRVSMGAVNDTCPASGKPVKADAGTATWRGHTIGFCCPNCVAPWNSKSAKEKDEFVAQCTKP